MTSDIATTEAEPSPFSRLAWLIAGLWAILIAASSVALWQARQYNVDHGPPCRSRGPWGCGFFEPATYAVGAIVIAAPFVIVAAIIWIFVGRWWPRVAAAIVAAIFVAWLVFYALAFDGALNTL